MFVERLWRSVKDEHVSLHAYESVSEATQQMPSDFLFDNSRRPHSSLGWYTPDMTSFKNHLIEQAA